MNALFRKIVAIVGLAFMVCGAVLLIIVSFNAKNETLTLLAIISLAVGILCYMLISIFKALPSQIAKEEKRRKAEEDYYNSLNNEESSGENSDENSDENS